MPVIKDPGLLERSNEYVKNGTELVLNSLFGPVILSVTLVLGILVTLVLAAKIWRGFFDNKNDQDQ